MLKQLLGSSLMEILKPGFQRNVESGETSFKWLYPQSIGSQCKIKDQIYYVGSDCLHQEYLTINLGSTSDWWKLQLPLVRLCSRWRGRCWATGAAWGRGRDPGSLTHSLSLSLPIHISDSAATSQDGSIFRMQGSEGCVSSSWGLEIPNHGAWGASVGL